MPLRTKVILIIIAGLALIAAMIIWFVMSEKQLSPKTDETAAPPKVSAPAAGSAAPAPAVVSEKEKKAVSVKALATSFAERFGSFSNQGDYINFNDLLPYMTPGMAKWVQETYIPKLKMEHSPDGFYYQILTLAPITQILEENEAKIKINVNTQRNEKLADAKERSFLQDLLIIFVKSGENWLVDSAYWQKEK